MTLRVIGLAMAVAAVSNVLWAQEALEPVPVSVIRENADYYNEREVAVSGYVVDSHTEWYSDPGGDYMTWNLLISDVGHPDASNPVLLCYESGFNIDRIREASEIANIQKDMERQVTVVGEYGRNKDVLNLRKLMYYEDGEPFELDTDVGDNEHVQVYRQYGRDFDYDIHYSVWFNYSYIWPHPHWWVCWEPVYIMRPPTYYVVYYTPWRLYRHRIHPVRVPPVSHVRHVVHGDGDHVVRVNPRDSRERVVRTPAGSGSRVVSPERVRVVPERSSPPARTQPQERTNDSSRVSPERVRVAPQAHTETRSSTEVREPIRVAPERSAPPVRTEPPERTRVVPETRISPPAEVRALEVLRHEVRLSAPTQTAPLARDVSRAPVRVAPERVAVPDHGSSGRERPAELRRH